MKYRIDGVKNSRTIRNIMVINDKNKRPVSIEVIYLDDTNDIVEYTKDNYERILNIMKSQGLEFIKYKNQEQVSIKACSKIVGYIHLILIIFLAVLVVVNSKGLTALTWILLLTTPLDLFYQYKNYSKIKELDKYDIFLNQLENKLGEYKEIVEKEKVLDNGKTTVFNELKKLNNISDLDRLSVSDLICIKNKIERYCEIVGTVSKNAEENEKLESNKQKVMKKQ